jgi:hypothetical protein
MTHQSPNKEEQMPTYPSPLAQPAKRHRFRSLAALSVLGACLVLTACGSSGGGSSSATATSSATSNKGGGSGSNRFAALRSCLQKQGITLPSPPSGTTRQPGGPGAGAPGGGPRGLQLPNGVSQAQLQAALKKCGAGGFGGRAAGFNSASARAALAKYAACLRQNAINVPAPNTSGNGPVFNTKGIDTSSSKFKAAQSKCQSDLKGAFPRGSGGGGTPPGAVGSAG